MSKYSAKVNTERDDSVAIGVLLVNLGSPDEPTAPALRRYLRQFLADSRVIETPRLLWWLILNLFILPFRPKKSAALYRSIWTEQGSPLVLNTKLQCEGLRKHLAGKSKSAIAVEYGMCVGEPSVEKALDSLREQGISRLFVLPMFPQYSGTTTGSVFDNVVRVLQSWRVVPEFHMLMDFHDEPLFISALAESISQEWQKREGGRHEKLLISFHGLPQRYVDAGDPYYQQCQKNTCLLVEALGLKPEQYQVSFQSLFGREEWIKPYTDATLKDLAKSGVKSVDVICPAFTADCLETLEEIEIQNKEAFLEAGGESYHYIPALNARDSFIEALGALVLKNIDNWLED